MSKERLDRLVQRQRGVSRAKAQGLIHAGQVFTQEGRCLDKPGIALPEDSALCIREGPRFVSRGGDKLEAALDAFGVDVHGVAAIDAGASTGGFTDCLLQRGAARVYAVAVGYGQLAWTLRQDPRVIVLERTNIRRLTREALDIPPAFFTADCSFISLTLVLPALKALLAKPAEGIVLIKPQFEATKAQVGKGGVVRDERVREDTIGKVLDAARALGFAVRGVIPSPLLGPAGNREFLAHLALAQGTAQ